MAELADAPDLGSGVHRRAGSSPVIRTLKKPCKRNVYEVFLCLKIELDPFIYGMEKAPVYPEQAFTALPP